MLKMLLANIVLSIELSWNFIIIFVKGGNFFRLRIDAHFGTDFRLIVKLLGCSFVFPVGPLHFTAVFKVAVVYEHIYIYIYIYIYNVKTPNLIVLEFNRCIVRTLMVYAVSQVVLQPKNLLSKRIFRSTQMQVMCLLKESQFKPHHTVPRNPLQQINEAM